MLTCSVLNVLWFVSYQAREQQQESGTPQQPAGNNSKATSLTGTLRRLKLNKVSVVTMSQEQLSILTSLDSFAELKHCLA